MPGIPTTKRLLETQKELGTQRETQPSRRQDEKEVLTQDSKSVVCKINTLPHGLSDNVEHFVKCVKYQAYWDIESFKAGQIKQYFPRWAELTSDSEILKMVSGYKLQFDEIPCQKFTPHRIVFSNEDSAIIENEIDKLLQKKVIKTCVSESGDYISNVFIRAKRDNTF